MDFLNEGFRPRPVPAPADFRLGCGKLAQSQAGWTCDPRGGLFPIQLPGAEQLSGLAEEVRHLNFIRDARALTSSALVIAGSSAGLTKYGDTVVGAIGDRRNLVLVAQSFGGLTAPRVCERARAQVDLVVLVAGLLPAPGEKHWRSR